MSDALIVGIITGAVSLTGIFLSSKNTRDAVTNKLDTNQRVMNNEIEHIKETITEMKSDIKSHNNYAKLFSENLPVLNEKISTITDRIEKVENKLENNT